MCVGVLAVFSYMSINIVPLGDEPKLLNGKPKPGVWGNGRHLMTKARLTNPSL